MSDNQPQGVSLNPDTFVQGGLVSDIDVTLDTVRFVEWDYRGAIDHPVLALHLHMKDAEGNEYDEYPSAGDLKRLKPSDDGKRAIPVGGVTGLVQSTNASQLLMSIVNAGFPKNKLSDDVSVFDGINVHINRIAAPKREGLTNQRKDGREPTILVITKINTLPWDAPTKSTKGGKKTSPADAVKSATPGAGSPELDDKTVALVMQVVSAAGGSANRSTLPGEIFKLAKGDPDQAKITQLAFQPAWLGNEARPWKYDTASGVISLG